MSGKEMFLGSAKEAASYGANTFMLYTGAPQNTRRKEISEMNITAGLEYMKEHNISDIVVHAPYIINLGNSIKPETFELAVDFLADELTRAEAMECKRLVLHPGSHVNAGAEAGIKQIIRGLNSVLTKDTKVQIALETMAGKGSEVGSKFEELAAIFDGVVYNDKLGVCFDTCHVNDSGYDIVNDFEGVIESFDKILGKEKIVVFHINDSKNQRGDKKDRHENIGFGTIGFKALYSIVHHKDFKDVVKILETPFIKDGTNSYAPYKYEIEMLKTGVFDKDLQQKCKMMK